MHRPHLPLLRRLLLGGVLVLAATTVAAAGLAIAPQSTAKAATAEPAKPAVETVPPGDIPTRADTDERFLQDVARRTQQPDPSARLARQLDELAAGISLLTRSFSRQDLQELSAAQLEGIASHWRFYDHELVAWRREMQRVSAPYSDDAAELASRRGVWEATRSALAASGIATALSDRVTGILAEINQAERALSAPLNAQIDLGRRANAVQASIDAGKKAVAAAFSYHDRRLSMIDTTPLWVAWDRSQFSAFELKGMAGVVPAERTFLRQWSEANEERLLWFGIAAAVLLPILLWMTYRSRQAIATGPEMRASAEVVRRPLSAWLVVVLVGVPFAFPDAPPVVARAALLLALVPVLRLLPPAIKSILGSWPYVATVLYVLYRLSQPLQTQPLYFRLYMLVVAVLTATALVWLLLTPSGRDGEPPLERVRPVVRGLGWFAVAALLTAIGANIVGNVSLAEMLVGAVLDSAYFGLALFAGANVLVSMIRVLLARRLMTQFKVVTQHAGPLLDSLSKLIMLGALVAWLVVALSEFHLARPVFSALRHVLGFPLEMGEISVTAGSILLFAVALWVGYWVARTVRLVLEDDVLPKMALPRGVSNSISTLTYYALITGGVFVALAAAGFHLDQLALVVGALSVGIGFGLQTVVNNFVSGLILMFERPVQPGDVVEIAGTQGKIIEIGMRATRLATFEGADVVVPNGTLLSEKLINWTLRDMSRRVDIPIGVAYGSDPRQVLQLLLEVARSTPGVAAQPEVAVVFMGFGPSSLDFSIRAWTHDFDNWVRLRSELCVRVYEALAAAGIQIPFPQQELHLRSVSEQARQGLAAAIKPGAPPGA